MHPPGNNHILLGELNGDGVYWNQISYSGQSLDEGEVPAGALVRMIPRERGDIGDEDLGHGYLFPNDEIIQPKTAGQCLRVSFSNAET